MRQVVLCDAVSGIGDQDALIQRCGLSLNGDRTAFRRMLHTILEQIAECFRAVGQIAGNSRLFIYLNINGNVFQFQRDCASAIIVRTENSDF